MKRIASFEVDHTTLTPGLYLSRADGDVTTYDLRFVRPNTPPFLPNAVMHTLSLIHIYPAAHLPRERFGRALFFWFCFFDLGFF